jgi:hypothetical protein
MEALVGLRYFPVSYSVLRYLNTLPGCAIRSGIRNGSPSFGVSGGHLVFSPLETLALSLACGAIFENGKGSLFRREGPAEGRVTRSEAAIQSAEKPRSSLLHS